MSKKALFITLGAVAVAAAALVPYKVKTEKDEETQKTTGVKLRALTYSLNVTANADKTGVDIELKVPNVKNVNLINICKHIELGKKEEKEAECCCEEPCENAECCKEACEDTAEKELDAKEEALNEAVECL